MPLPKTTCVIAKVEIRNRRNLTKETCIQSHEERVAFRIGKVEIQIGQVVPEEVKVINSPYEVKDGHWFFEEWDLKTLGT